MASNLVEHIKRQNMAALKSVFDFSSQSGKQVASWIDIGILDPIFPMLILSWMNQFPILKVFILTSFFPYIKYSKAWIEIKEGLLIFVCLYDPFQFYSFSKFDIQYFLLIVNRAVSYWVNFSFKPNGNRRLSKKLKQYLHK